MYKNVVRPQGIHRPWADCFAASPPGTTDFAKGLVDVIYFYFIGNFPFNTGGQAFSVDAPAGARNGLASPFSEIL